MQTNPAANIPDPANDPFYKLYNYLEDNFANDAEILPGSTPDVNAIKSKLNADLDSIQKSITALQPLVDQFKKENPKEADAIDYYWNKVSQEVPKTRALVNALNSSESVPQLQHDVQNIVDSTQPDSLFEVYRFHEAQLLSPEDEKEVELSMDDYSYQLQKLKDGLNSYTSSGKVPTPDQLKEIQTDLSDLEAAHDKVFSSSNGLYQKYLTAHNLTNNYTLSRDFSAEESNWGKADQAAKSFVQDAQKGITTNLSAEVQQFNNAESWTVNDMENGEPPIPSTGLKDGLILFTPQA